MSEFTSSFLGAPKIRFLLVLKIHTRVSPRHVLSEMNFAENLQPPLHVQLHATGKIILEERCLECNSAERTVRESRGNVRARDRSASSSTSCPQELIHDQNNSHHRQDEFLTIEHHKPQHKLALIPEKRSGGSWRRGFSS